MRKRAVRTAIEASIGRAAPGDRLQVTALRRHLAEYYRADLAGASVAELARACRGLARVRGQGKRAVLLGVQLRRPGARQLAAAWERVLEGERLAAEPPMIRRTKRDEAEREFDDDDVSLQARANPDNKLHVPGLSVKIGGIWRQTHDHNVVLLTADSRNGDGTRGRVRRHVAYFERLRKAADRTFLSRRERIVVDVVLAGGRRWQVGQVLGLKSTSAVHKVMTELHRKLRIRGPGHGR